MHGKNSDIVSRSEVDVGGKEVIIENSSDQVSSSNETIVIENDSESMEIKKENPHDEKSEAVSLEIDRTEDDADQDNTIDSLAVSLNVTGSG